MGRIYGLVVVLVLWLPPALPPGPTPVPSSRWEPVGPSGGGWIEDVVAHPTRPEEVWCMTDLTGLFRSRDRGLTWAKKTAAVEQAILARKQIASHNRQFAIDPREPQHLYWGVADMVWASHDGGETWEKSWGQLPPFGDEASLKRPITVSVGPRGAVFTLDAALALRASLDHGRTWRTLTSPPVTMADRETPPFPVAAPDGTLYVSGRSPEGLAVSKDGGKSWTLQLPGSAVINVKFAKAGARPSTLFALDAQGRLYRTDDGGATFKAVARVSHRWSPGRRFAGGLDVGGDGSVMLWAEGAQQTSRDWGETWQALDIRRGWSMGSYPGMNRWESPQGKCSNLAVSSDGATWYKADSSMVARSTDSGRTWSGSTTGIQILCYYGPPGISPQDPETILAPTLDQGLFRTTDGGRTWQAVKVRPEYWQSRWVNHDVSSVAWHPREPATVYCVWHTHEGPRKPLLFLSKDAGTNWTQLASPYDLFGATAERGLSDKEYTRLVFDPEDPRTLHYSDAGLGVLSSHDGGAHWTLGLRATGGQNLVVSPSGRSLYLQCQRSGGLWASHDRGQTWSRIRDDDVGGLVHHPREEDTVFVTTGQHANFWEHKGTRPGVLWRTRDAGRTWERLAACDGGALYADPARPEVMLMSTLGGGRGILRSLDAGRTWHDFMAGAPSYTVAGFAYGGKPGRVYLWNFGNLARHPGLYDR